MSYKFSFADNAVYSASDINEITKRLVTSGIEDSFVDGVPYNLSKFNEEGYLLYTSGVVPSNITTLKVCVENETEILINPGVAFFNDGATIEIEEGGEVLNYTLGSKNYVYLKNDLINKNICYPCCSVEEPTGDYVLLAEINEDGSVCDKRVYARGKLGGYQSVSEKIMFLTDRIKTTAESYTLAQGTAEYFIGENIFKYIISIEDETANSRHRHLSLYRISDGKSVSFHGYGNSGEAGIDENGKISLGSDHRSGYYTAEISFAEGKLTVSAKSTRTSGRYTVGEVINIPVKFIFI